MVEGRIAPTSPSTTRPTVPGPPPNMFRPMMVAPAPPRMSSANRVLALTSPPSSPWLSRNALSGPASCGAPHRRPRAMLWRLVSGPATNPSIDIVMFSFSLLIAPPSVDMLV